MIHAGAQARAPRSPAQCRAQGPADQGAELKSPPSLPGCLYWFLSAIFPYFCMCIGSICPIYFAYVHLWLGCSFCVFLSSKPSLSELLALLSIVLPVSAFNSIFLYLYMSVADFLSSCLSWSWLISFVTLPFVQL